MLIYLFPFRYLNLRNERGWPLYVRDFWIVVMLAAILSVPFIVADQANYFGDNGFLDRVSGFASTLTGFYVAALVAVATFSIGVRELDEPITVGRVSLPKRLGGYTLSRREYVCSMFGYLSLVSLILSITSIASLSLAETLAHALREAIVAYDLRPALFTWMRAVSIAAFGVTISHLLVTTMHGLYYLIERLYAKAPAMQPKPQ